MKITIEGVQGEGKSTAANALVTHLTNHGFTVDLWDDLSEVKSFGPQINNPLKYARVYVKIRP